MGREAEWKPPENQLLPSRRDWPWANSRVECEPPSGTTVCPGDEFSHHCCLCHLAITLKVTDGRRETWKVHFDTRVHNKYELFTSTLWSGSPELMPFGLKVLEIWIEAEALSPHLLSNSGASQAASSLGYGKPVLSRDLKWLSSCVDPSTMSTFAELAVPLPHPERPGPSPVPPKDLPLWMSRSSRLQSMFIGSDQLNKNLLKRILGI